MTPMQVELDLESLVRLVASLDPVDNPTDLSESAYSHLWMYRQRAYKTVAEWDLSALRRCEPQFLWRLYQTLRPDQRTVLVDICPDILSGLKGG